MTEILYFYHPTTYLNGGLIRVFNKNEVITIHIQCVCKFKSEEVVIN